MVPRLHLLLAASGVLFSIAQCAEDTVSQINPDKYSVAKEVRYLLYDVNHGEGFNLRRDVYMRIAETVRQLRENGSPAGTGENFHLVLPPWGGLYHWRDEGVRLRWSSFFDIESLRAFVPVLEFEEWLEAVPNGIIDRVVYLQHFAEGWGEEFVFKSEKRDCIDGNKYYKKTGEIWKGWFFSYSAVRSADFGCVSFQGDSGTLASLIAANYSTETSLFIDRGETALHEHYGERQYWRTRRSMRYAKRLEQLAADYRREFLDSDDIRDKTELSTKWEDESARRDGRGGPYLCAHWRRRDFLRAHGKELPSVEGTAKQLKKLAKKNKVEAVFLATDADEEELKELGELLEKGSLRMHLYRPDEGERLTDGQKAIVEQIICANARFFIGSHVSTFSFRIQEDREIRGLPAETTFNRLCPDQSDECEQPAKWTIRY